MSAAMATSLLAASPAAASTNQVSLSAATQSTCSGDWDYGGYQFGHYKGNIYVPSTTHVTDAGLEAQCLLRLWNSIFPDEISHPGPLDGVFGPMSQTSMEDLQRWVNEYRGGNPDGDDLDVDGLPGPQSWGDLRHPPLEE